MEVLTAHAAKHHLRCLVCETQTTNVPSIQFYRSMGFHLEGLDLSYYTNEDQERGEMAVFMKKRLGPEQAGIC
jgi:ribosomal protein S18 acetylase RimI-like enzyme